MRPMRVGIIGCGNIARVHATAYQRLPMAELAAVADTAPGRAAAFAEQYGGGISYESVDRMLAEADLDAISICTPHPTHVELIEQAAAAGVHVITEKPMAVSLEAADRAIMAARRGGIKLGVVYQRRYWPAAQRLRHAIDAGKLGRLVLGHCIVRWSRTPEYYGRTPWRGKWSTEGGGVLVNHASHALDMFQWFMGPIDSVFGHWDNLTHPAVEVETMAMATVRFTSGALGTIEASLNPVQTERGHSRIVVYGQNGAWASVHEEPEGTYGLNPDWEIPGEEESACALYAEERARADYIYKIVAAGREVPNYRADCHQAQLADFLEAIRDNREPLVNGEEGWASVEIIEAIYRSGRTGDAQPFSARARPYPLMRQAMAWAA